MADLARVIKLSAATVLELAVPSDQERGDTGTHRRSIGYSSVDSELSGHFQKKLDFPAALWYPVKWCEGKQRGKLLHRLPLNKPNSLWADSYTIVAMWSRERRAWRFWQLRTGGKR